MSSVMHAHYFQCENWWGAVLEKCKQVYSVDGLCMRMEKRVGRIEFSCSNIQGVCNEEVGDLVVLMDGFLAVPKCHGLGER